MGEWGNIWSCRIVDSSSDGMMKLVKFSNRRTVERRDGGVGVVVESSSDGTGNSEVG